MTEPNVRETEPERRARIQGNLQRLKAAGAPPERIQAYIETERITPEMERERTPLTAMENARGMVANAGEGVGFSLADEVMGGARGLLSQVSPFHDDITMSEGIDQVRTERDEYADRHPKTALGLTIGGGLASGIGVGLGAARAVAPVAAKGAAVVASGAGGGALAGYGSGEGPALDPSRLGRAAGFGALGAGLGAAGARIANSRFGDAVVRNGRTLLDVLAEASEGPSAYGALTNAAARTGEETMDAATSAAVRSIAARTGGASSVPQARDLLEQLNAAGLGGDAIGADVLPSGGRELRRAFNVSPQAAASGREQLLTRGANVGPRAERALTQATGLSPQTTAAGVDELVTTRAANAKPLYDAAIAEGRGKVAPPQLRAFLDEPPIQRAVARLRELDAFRGASDESPEMLDAIYKVLSDRHATIKASQLVDPENLGRFQQWDLESAKERFLSALESPGERVIPAVTQTVPPPSVAQSPAPSLRDAMEAHRSRLGEAARRNEGTVMQRTAREGLDRRSAEASVPAPRPFSDGPMAREVELTPARTEAMPAVMPGYRKAVTQFADDSRLKQAYDDGMQMFNKREGDIRAAMAEMTPDELDLFKRGAFDALLERTDNVMPNAGLGAAARQSKRAGQSTVDSQAAAKRMRAIFGDAEYEQILAAAKGEGRFTQTANDALANSTTAQQLGDMGLFGQMAVEAAGAQPTNPAWWARGAQGAVDRVKRIVDEPASRRGAELMLGQPKTLLDLLEQLGISDASRAATTQAGSAVATRVGAGASTPRRP